MRQLLYPRCILAEIRSAKLFTIPTTGHQMKLAQRITNLCIPVAVMRLLSYALVNFLPLYYTGNTTDLEEFKKSILKYPKYQSNDFIQKLVATCCEVISPRFLNGVYDPGDFHIASQERNIREYI